MDKIEKNFELNQSYAIKKSLQQGSPVVLNPIPKPTGNKLRQASNIRRNNSPTKIDTQNDKRDRISKRLSASFVGNEEMLDNFTKLRLKGSLPFYYKD